MNSFYIKSSSRGIDKKREDERIDMSADDHNEA